MRCKKHSTDLTSITGVCASCLRERLFSVIVAQEQVLALHENSSTKSPLPEISRRKIGNSTGPVQSPINNHRLQHSLSDQRFYNTPLNTGACIGDTSTSGNTTSLKKSFIRFSSFSNLFRSSNRNGDSDSDSVSGNRTSFTKKPTHDAGVVRKQRFRDRGMSPAMSSDEDEFDDEFSESSESWKATPRSTPARRGGGAKSVSGLKFCLSPLVRASPSRQWSQKGKPPVDGGFSGDNRTPAMPHLSDVKSFCANRSRKLADFGRFNPNR